VTGKPAKSGTIQALAGARGLPPLMVILYHFSEGHHYSGIGWLDLIAARGYLWVEFFFTLSGFILTYAYGRRLTELWSLKGYGAFLRARLIRLYPLHLFMLAVIGAMILGLHWIGQAHGYLSIFEVKYHQDISTKGLVLSLLLVQAWNSMDRLTWNGLSWFVSVEFALCLLFPLVLRLAHGKVWRGFALMAAGIAGMLALLFTSQHGLDLTYHNGVWRGLADFAIGAGMAVLFARAREAQVPAWVHSALQMILLALLGYAVMETGWSHTRNDIFTVAPIILLVFALAFDQGVVAQLLKMKVPQLLGEWSYAIYLGQTSWLLMIRYFEQRLYPDANAIVWGTRFSTLVWWLEPVGLVLVCVAWGALLAECIELPVAAWLRARLGRRLDPKTIPTPN
jgi:peptidoglycan/LPS O-acetylase OafA/YrhL